MKKALLLIVIVSSPVHARWDFSSYDIPSFAPKDPDNGGIYPAEFVRKDGAEMTPEEIDKATVECATTAGRASPAGASDTMFAIAIWNKVYRACLRVHGYVVKKPA